MPAVTPPGPYPGPGVIMTPWLPPLKTLVYSPDVMIFIGARGVQYNVSKDVTRFSVERVEDGASSLQFTLANWGRRYDKVFHPMDPVTCFLKRVEFLQVFSGYLDTAHFTQLYPGTADYSATCTLKRLIHTWWDPALPASVSLMQQARLDQMESGDGQGQADSGLGSLLRRILIDVGNWTGGTIHIQNFPSIFFEFMKQQLPSMVASNNQQVEQFKRLLLGQDTSGGQGTVGASTASNAAPGAYTPQGVISSAADNILPMSPPGVGQVFYIREIIMATDERRMGPRSTELTNAAGVRDAATAGEPQRGWPELQGVAQNWQANETKSDAAILAVACCLAESSLLMQANYAVPDSLNFPHDKVGADHDSIGLFQQRNTGWGSVAQRMNPRASAGMFLNKLNTFDWRNMDPGSAIQRVQISATPGVYTQYIPQATALVQAERTAMGSNPAIASEFAAATASGTGGVANLANTLSTGGGLMGGSATSSPGTTLVGSVSAIANKPNPDSEGAVQWAMTQIGTPYGQGKQVPHVELDCSGLVQLAYRSIGVETGRTTWDQASNGRHVPPSNIQRGNIVQPHNGHSTIWLGNGQIIEEADFGTVCRISNYQTNYGSLENAYAILWFADNGGASPLALGNTVDPLGNLPGQPPGTNMTTASGQGTGSEGGHTEPIARNLFSFMFDVSRFASDTHQLFKGEKAFINGQPLMQIVQAICSAGLRSFCSAPNGDFVAYYPDYFGLDGGIAAMDIEDIECIDIHLNLSDDELTTHVYVAGDETGVGNPQGTMGWIDTAGVATVEDTWLYMRMIQIAPDIPDGLSGRDLMFRYGVRPLMKEYASVRSHVLEFFLAVKIFMLKWAAQYKTTVQFTFMPELFPGMRINFVGHNLQVYVTAVRHSGDFENGFYTEADIMAPSNPNVKSILNNPISGPINPNATNLSSNLAPQIVIGGV